LNGTGQINHYTFLRELGKGSFGTVKDALSSLDGKHYRPKLRSAMSFVPTVIASVPSREEGR
jgi:serine/threonine protein kinase